MFSALLRLFGFARRRPALDVAAVCERGQVRPDNQDHVTVDRARLVYCVADGMGGGDGGAKASEIICRCVARAASRRAPFSERLARIHEALQAANREIRAYAAKAGFTRQMASTAAVLAFESVRGDKAVVGWVGDSRVYRFRAGELGQVTRDHTVGNELSALAANRAMADGLRGRSLALSHMLTRAVGVLPEVTPEWRKLDVRRGDVFLLCSDGVYDMLPNAELCAELALGGTAREMVERLARRVVAVGAADNYSMVLVQIGAYR